MYDPDEIEGVDRRDDPPIGPLVYEVPGPEFKAPSAHGTAIAVHDAKSMIPDELDRKEAARDAREYEEYLKRTGETDIRRGPDITLGAEESGPFIGPRQVIPEMGTTTPPIIEVKVSRPSLWPWGIPVPDMGPRRMPVPVVVAPPPIIPIPQVCLPLCLPVCP